MFRIDPSIESHIRTIAQQQFGLISVAQLRAVGVSESWARQRAVRGKLLKVNRAVYGFPGVPRTYEQLVLAAVLAFSPSVASHYTAMRLWKIDYCDSYAVEISISRPHHTRLKGVVPHRSVYFLKEEQTEINSIPCTTYARTLVDVSGRFGLGQLGRILDNGLRENKVTLSQLRRCVSELAPAPGRRLSKIRKLLEERLPGYYPGDSDLELKVLRWIVEGGLPEPAQQHHVVLDGHPLDLDLAYPKQKIDVEADGFKFHTDRSAFDRDRFRENLLVSHGWRILRFTSTSTKEHVVKTVAMALGVPFGL